MAINNHAYQTLVTNAFTGYIVVKIANVTFHLAGGSGSLVGGSLVFVDCISRQKRISTVPRPRT